MEKEYEIHVFEPGCSGVCEPLVAGLEGEEMENRGQSCRGGLQ